MESRDGLLVRLGWIGWQARVRPFLTTFSQERASLITPARRRVWRETIRQTLVIAALLWVAHPTLAASTRRPRTNTPAISHVEARLGTNAAHPRPTPLEECSVEPAEPGFSPLDVVWIEDALLPNAPQSWPVETVLRASGNNAFSPVIAPMANIDGLYTHFEEARPIDGPHRFVAYVLFSNCEDPPSGLTLRLQFDGWRTDYFWGAAPLKSGFPEPPQQSPFIIEETFHVGDVPAAGQWVRLEVVIEPPDKPVRGFELLSEKGRVWWDRIGVAAGLTDQPSITAVDPRHGPAAGGTPVHVFGGGFVQDATTAYFGSAEATTVTFVSSSELIATAPSGTGTVDVQVMTDGGAGTLAGAFTYVQPPAITSVTPAKGGSAGNQTVFVDGSNFVDGETTVTFGGVSAASVHAVSPERLEAVTPAHAAGVVQLIVTTPGGTATSAATFQYFDPPAILGFSPAEGLGGTSVVITGSNFDVELAGNQVTIGGVSAPVLSGTAQQLVVEVPANASTGPVTVTTAGGSAVSTAPFVVLTYTHIEVTPATASITVGATQSFQARAFVSNGAIEDVTDRAVWSVSNSAVATIESPGLARGLAAGSTSVTATFSGLTDSAVLTVTQPVVGPPDPATVATPIDPTVATDFADAIRFLYEGDPPIQTGVVPGAIEDTRIAVIRGRVFDRNGLPVSSVRVEIAGAPELGSTLSRADGWFDLAVNGGGTIIVTYTKPGFLPLQRSVPADWHRFAFAPNAVMTPLDANVTTVDLGNSTTMQVARGSIATDSDGERRATLFFPAQTTASMIMPDGTSQPLSTGAVRATEYTVGSGGPQAMPAPLPAMSAYTYCVELSVDEALAAGADRVAFSQPVVVYVDNFLGFAVGEPVPVGYYDRRKAAWVPERNGLVVKILATAGGVADIDTNGDGAPENEATLAAAGIGAAERERLASLYVAGQTLWRFAVTHFTPYDVNWPIAPSADLLGERPGRRPVAVDRQIDDACRYGGSIIDCESQSLGERVAVSGTGFSLNYDGARFPGRSAARTITVSLTDDSLPDTLANVQITIDVGGKRYERVRQAAPNLEETFTWDGKDAYGRTVQGAQDVAIYVGYEYPVLYRRPGQGLGFADFSTGPGLLVARTPFTLVDEQHVQFLPWDARETGVGGWSLDVHHMFDVEGNRILYGDGSTRTGDGAAGTIKTVVGRRPDAFTCSNTNGALGTQATIHKPRGIAPLPDGSVAFVDQSCGVLFRVNRVGTISPAATSAFLSPYGVAASADGTIYVSEIHTSRVFRVSTTGVVTRIAGTGTQGYSGDGGPALAAQLNQPTLLAVAPDGTLHIVDSMNGVIRRITNDGRILTAVGNGEWEIGPDGSLATSTGISDVQSLAFGSDGTLYFVSASNEHVFAVSPDGVLSRLARVCEPECGDTAQLRAIAMGPDGTLYVTRFYSNVVRIYRIDRDGTAAIVADGRNGPAQEFPPTDRSFGGDDGPAIGASYCQPTAIAIGADGAIYMTDTGNRRVRRITPSIARPNSEGFAVASQDGSELHVFDERGRHVRTHDTRVGAVLYQFSYDGAGKLTRVTDVDGNQTLVERDAAGRPLAIVAPGGQRTQLTTHADGMLASIANEAEENYALSYNGSGLLTTMLDPKQQTSVFTYDALGRLSGDQDRAGGAQTFAIDNRGDQFTVTRRTPLGRVTTHRIEWQSTGERKRTTVSPVGLVATAIRRPSGDSSTTNFDGTVIDSTLGPDPRFGTQAPFVREHFVSLPQGGALFISQERTATLSNAADPLSLSQETQTVRFNGKAYTSTYSASDRSITARTPMGRSGKSFLDLKGRLARVENPGFASVGFVYDGAGRLTSITQATRSQTFEYNERNELVLVRDALGRPTEFAYDTAGRLVEQTLPDGRTVHFAHDPNGNVTAVTPPGRPAHTFTWTPMDAVATVQSPAAVGGLTRFAYNLDNDPTTVQLEDESILAHGYDGAGQLTSLSTPAGNYAFGYDAATGGIASIATPPGDASLTFGWNGPLLTGTSWSGAVSGEVGFGYDGDLRLQGVSVNGSEITFGYDSDGLLLRAGALNLVRDASSGILTSSTLGVVTETWTYNPHGEPATHAAAVTGSPVFQEQFDRDAGGRLIRVVENVTGATSTRDYAYDGAGRLSTVTSAGVQAVTYTYDENGNRLTRTSGSGVEEAAYDAEDRLLSYGGATYSYTPNGHLAARTDGTGTTEYHYDVLGSLRRVVTPAGQEIEYVIDGQLRRVGKKVNGTLVRGWLYGDHLRILAELDESGTVRSRFVYASRTNVPDYMVRDGVTLRIISDHLGSPRLVVNTADSGVVQRIDYDEFGRVIVDTNPGFQPFGFGGGLYDPDTKLVRFGARDYDPHTGRWTAKDPILFDGGDTNLYAYVLNDPVNLIDPAGLEWYEAFEWLESDAGQAFTNFVVGFGDASSLGLTRLLRDEEDAQWVDTCSGWYTAGLVAGTINSYAYNRLGYTRGYEFTRNPKAFRLAPWGNRTGHPVGRYPHYHRRITDGTGKTVPGGSVDWHRPWEKGW